MSLSLTTNVGALTARRYLDGAQSSLTSSLERLSSGQRINRAADDAAGLAISEKMRAQVGGLQQAARNAQDGVSLIQTAEGALAETHAMLQRMRTLAVQAASDTYTDSDREKLTAEVVKLVDQIQLAATSTQFNGMALLDGSFAGRELQIGAGVGQTITLDVDAAGTAALGLVEAPVVPTTPLTPTTPSTPNPPAAPGRVTATAVKEPDVTGVPGRLPVKTLEDPLQPSKRWDDWADLGEVPHLIDQDGEVPTGTFTVNGADLSVTGAGTTGTVSADGTRIDFANGSWLAFDAAVWKDNASTPPSGVVTVTGAPPVPTPTTPPAPTPTAPSTGNPGALLASLRTREDAVRALAVIDTAIGRVSDRRSALGALQNRLAHTIANLGVSAENLAAADSRIRDADMAKEMVGFTRAQIIAQAGTTMLAQANQTTQAVLKLLG